MGHQVAYTNRQGPPNMHDEPEQDALFEIEGPDDGPTTDIDPVPPQAVQRSGTAGGAEKTPSLVEPHRYLQLSELAGAIRNAGHGCEAVRTCNQIERNDKGSAVYKIDCLEYSYRLTIKNGQSRIERLTANVIRK